MKEYGCCPKFKRGDDSTYTLMLQIVTFVNRLIRTFALFTDITKQRCACSVIFFKLWKIKYPLERIVPVREINNEI
jgi:hypothetical protein